MNPDFSDRTYTVEVMRTAVDPADAIKAICRLTTGPRQTMEGQETDGRTVRITHTFIPIKGDGFHRSPRIIVGPDQKPLTIPRRDKLRGVECSLYDVFIAQCGKHIAIAVPFHDLAETFFPKVDTALAGTQTVYERLDITNLVIRLGSEGSTKLAEGSAGDTLSLSVTRCHLAFADAKNRVPNIQQIRMTGANLGAAEEYQRMIAPVLKRGKGPITVTPIVLGFALAINNVKKSSATTDRHGNFKLWVAPGLRRLTRVFSLLGAIEMMENVSTTTTNVPILQSKAIKSAED